MSIERMKSMKENLISQTEAQFANLHNANTHELGEAIDMIKDLSEAVYYCTITDAIEKGGSESESYYTPYRDMDRRYGMMYYGNDYTPYYNYESYYTPTSYASNSGNMSNGGGNGRSYTPMRDSREGRSPMYRKTYMEDKHLGADHSTKMRDLEQYLQELSTDIAEMVNDATPEEKQAIKKKMEMLGTKIQ